MIISDSRINWGVNLFFSILIAIVCLLLHTDGYYDFHLRFCAAIGLIPIISAVLILFRTKEITIAVISLVLYQTWNMFLSPYTWKLPIESLYRVFDTSDFSAMAIFSALSIWALYLGFFYGKEKIKSKPFFLPKYLNLRDIERVLLLMIIGGYLVQILQSIIGFFEIRFGFLSLIETMLPATVGAVAVLYWLRGGRKIFYILLCIVYIIYYFIYYIGGTLFIYSIFLVTAPTIMYVVERRKIPYVTICLLAILLMPVYLSRHAYRNEGLHSEGSARMLIGLNILKNEYGNANIQHWKDLYNANNEDYNVDNRMEGVSYLGTVIHSIDTGKAEYAYGETMIWLPTMVVPHFLIPFRPSQNMGTEWAEYYGVKDPSWRASINFPMLCEFYVNFGYLGMILFSFLNGMLIVWFMRKFNNGEGDINLILLIFIITKIIVIEANVTLAYGSILQVMIVCWIFKLLKSHSNSPQVGLWIH